MSINVRSYKRRLKNGKTVMVKGYQRKGNPADMIPKGKYGQSNEKYLYCGTVKAKSGDRTYKVDNGYKFDYRSWLKDNHPEDTRGKRIKNNKKAKKHVEKNYPDAHKAIQRRLKAVNHNRRSIEI